MHFLKDKFAKDFNEKMVSYTVREAGQDAGISMSTISRINNGGLPDIETFAKAVYWMGKSPSEYFEVPQTELKEILKQLAAAGATIWGVDYAGKLIDQINKL